MDLSEENINNFVELNENFLILGNEMKKDVETKRNTFGYFSTGIVIDKENLLNNIDNFSDKIYTEYKE